MARVIDIGSASLPVAAYPPLQSLQVPVASGLRGAFVFGHGAALAGVNWATGGVGSKLFGAPSAGAGFLTFGLNDFVQTDIPETDALTFVIVARRPMTGDAGYIGNYAGGSLWGVSLYSSSSGSVMSATASRGGSSGGFGVSGTVGAFGLYVLTVPSSGQSRLDDLTEGNANLSASGARALTGGGNIRIGRLPSPTFGAANDQVLALIYDRVISDAERASVAVWARSYAASCGITV